jgi:dephospho-CoA kinase
VRALRVGLTGSIGAGKSEALRAFAAAGAQTHCADAVARELSGRGGPVAKAAARALGPTVLAADGSLDRPRVAAAVFSDAAARRRLERATHPLIARELSRRLARCRRPVAVVDAPLLFEAGLQGRFDLTVCVSAPAAARVARASLRDRSSRDAVLRRDRAQWPQRRKEALSDVVIFNGGSRAALRRAVAEYQRAFELLAQGLGGQP